MSEFEVGDRVKLCVAPLNISGVVIKIWKIFSDEYLTIRTDKGDVYKALCEVCTKIE